MIFFLTPSISIIFIIFLATSFSFPGSEEDGINKSNSSQKSNRTLHFMISGRNFPDTDPLGTLDPYVIVRVVEDEGDTENELARTDAITNTENPNWRTIFTFDFDRQKKQKWHFLVYDHDLAYFDDKIGHVWVNVSDYVHKNEFLQVNLNKKGYLVIKKAN